MSKNPKERPPFNDIIRYLVHLSSQEVSQGVFPRCSKPVQQTAKAVQVIKVEAAANKLHELNEKQSVGESKTAEPKPVG